MSALRHGHAPGHIRDAFCDGAEAFMNWDGKGPEPSVVFEVNYEPRRITISEACGLVWNCTDIMPSELFTRLSDRLEIKQRTYAAGSRALRQHIAKQRTA